MTRLSIVALFLLGACASQQPEREELPASRSDVTTALHRQLELVLHRHAVLEDGGEEARKEREELMRLAAEIAVRILRIDPNADIGRLAEQVERTR